MKLKTFALMLPLISILQLRAQSTVLISGKIENIDNGSVIGLYESQGQFMSKIADDTINNGLFQFNVSPNDDVNQFGLIGENEKFPPMMLSIYVEPGTPTKVNVTGNGYNLYTWNVDSPVEMQQSRNMFINHSRDLWDEHQRLSILKQQEIKKLRATDDETMRHAVGNTIDSLDVLQDSIDRQIHQREIYLLKTAEINDYWMNEMSLLAHGDFYIEGHPLHESLMELYKRIPQQWLDSETGEQITAYLFPPITVNIGEPMADGTFIGIDGSTHSLAEFKGKYILVDIWSAGCYPCVMSIPELKEVSETYSDKLKVVSISIDEKKAWKKAVAAHGLTDTTNNWRDPEGMHGLKLKYGANGIPLYILISPDGIVLNKETGYGTGSLKTMLNEYLNMQEPGN